MSYYNIIFRPGDHFYLTRDEKDLYIEEIKSQGRTFTVETDGYTNMFLLTVYK